MRKVILILALALGVNVNAQVVGGYLPVNSTKSATMGGLRVNGNETVTGTFSVGSTATVGTLYSTGIIRSASGTSSLTGLNNNGNLITSTFESTSTGYMDSKLRVGSVVAPSATLDVTGTLGVSSTFSLGSANLTGGNTGTVAVLSDAVFSFFLFATVTNPADATTYYFGNNGYQLSTTSSGSVTVPYNATLIGYDWSAVTSGAAGTTEASTLSINGTTNYTLSTSISFSTAYTNSSSMGLSQDFNANDKVNIKILTPTFATNPTAVYQGITLYFRRRS